VQTANFMYPTFLPNRLRDGGFDPRKSPSDNPTVHVKNRSVCSALISLAVDTSSERLAVVSGSRDLIRDVRALTNREWAVTMQTTSI
jgi:hypothetical protein